MIPIKVVDTTEYYKTSSINDPTTNPKEQLITDEDVYGNMMSTQFKEQIDKTNKGFFAYEHGTHVKLNKALNLTKRHQQNKIHIYIPQDIWTHIFSFVNIDYNISSLGFEYLGTSNQSNISMSELSSVCKTFFATLITSLTRYPHKEIITTLIWNKHRKYAKRNKRLALAPPLNEYLKKHLIRTFSFCNNFFYFINLYTPKAKLSTFNIKSYTNNTFYYMKQMCAVIKKQKEKFNRTQKLLIYGCSNLTPHMNTLNKAFKNLKILTIVRTSILINCIDEEQKSIFKKLVFLKLSYIKKTQLRQILNIKMEQLKHLHIKKPDVGNNPNVIEFIAENINKGSIKTLRKLCIRNTVCEQPSLLNIDKIMHIIKNLTYLYLSKYSIQIAKNTPFELTNLKHLIINMSSKNTIVKRQIQSLTPMYNISFHPKNTYTIALPTAPNLKTLEIYASQITRLKTYPNLKTLNLCNVSCHKNIETNFFNNLKSITTIYMQSSCCYPNQNLSSIHTPHHDTLQNQINLEFYTKIINGCTIEKIKTLVIYITHGMRDSSNNVQQNLKFPVEEDYYFKYKETEIFENFIKKKFRDLSSNKLNIKIKKLLICIKALNYNNEPEALGENLFYTEMKYKR